MSKLNSLLILAFVVPYFAFGVGSDGEYAEQAKRLAVVVEKYSGNAVDENILASLLTETKDLGSFTKFTVSVISASDEFPLRMSKFFAGKNLELLGNDVREFVSLIEIALVANAIIDENAPNAYPLPDAGFPDLALDNARDYYPLYSWTRRFADPLDVLQNLSLEDKSNLKNALQLGTLYCDEDMSQLLERFRGYAALNKHSERRFWKYIHRGLYAEIEEHFDKAKMDDMVARDRLKIGEELTFCPLHRRGKKKLKGFIELWRQEAQKGADSSETINYDAASDRLQVNKVGFSYHVFVDGSVIEVTFDPYYFDDNTLRPLNEMGVDISPEIEEIFAIAHDIGLAPHPLEGGGHKHLDITAAFRGNYGLFLRAFIDLHSWTFFPALQSGMRVSREKFISMFDFLGDRPTDHLRLSNLNVIKNFVAMHEGKSSAEFTLVLANLLRKYVYGKASKYYAVNLEHMKIVMGAPSQHDDLNTIEIRFLRPFRSNEGLQAFNELLSLRLNHLLYLQRRGEWPKSDAAKFWDYSRREKGARRAFSRYLLPMDLAADQFEAFLPEKSDRAPAPPPTAAANGEPE